MTKGLVSSISSAESINCFTATRESESLLELVLPSNAQDMGKKQEIQIENVM